jgi:hypothetical protein
MQRSDPPRMDEWPADKLPTGAKITIHGELYAVHTEGFGMRLAKPIITAGAGVSPLTDEAPADFSPHAFTRPAHYMEIWQYIPQGHAVMRWCVFGDLRQLGLADETRRTILRGIDPFRMVTTQARLDAAMANGQSPRLPYVVTLDQPLVAPPGLPCVVFEVPASMKELAGQRALLVDPNYRATPPPTLKLPKGPLIHA